MNFPRNLLVLFVTLFIFGTIATPTDKQHHVRNVTQFPANIDPENLVVRKNGNILMTASNQNILYEIDPTNGKSKVLHTFEGVSSLSGIAEIRNDVFALTAGNFSFASFTVVPESWSVWTIDLTQNTPTAKNVVDIPQAILPNGMTHTFGNTILIADCRKGSIFRVDTSTGCIDEVDHSDPLMQPVTATRGIEFGINGIHLSTSHKDVIYFTNTDQALLGKVESGFDYYKYGKAKKVADVVADDFIPGKSGEVHVASNNAIVTVYPNGQKSQFNFTSLSDSQVRVTALEYGKTNNYKNSLFGTVIVFGQDSQNTGLLIEVDGY